MSARRTNGREPADAGAARRSGDASRTRRAAKLSPATTEGSSTAMGTRTSCPLTTMLVAIPSGRP